MNLPAFLFGMLIATLIGAAFHLILGGNFGRLILYIFLSWLGFWGGHLLGDRIGWTFFSIGPLRMGTAVLASLLVLGVGYWLSLVKPVEQR